MEMGMSRGVGGGGVGKKLSPNVRTVTAEI